MSDASIIIIAIISGLSGSIIVASVMAYYNKRSLQSNTFTTIFKMLTEKDHWEARRNVVKSYKEFIKKDEPDLKLFDENYMRLVRSDFDQIGMLIYREIVKEQIGDKELDKNSVRWPKGFIDKDLFLEGFSGSVINSWYALEYVIKFHRVHVNSERYMLFFEQLFEDAKDFSNSKSKLRENREENPDLITKLERWISEIPNRSPDDVEKIKNY